MNDSGSGARVVEFASAYGMKPVDETEKAPPALRSWTSAMSHVVVTVSPAARVSKATSSRSEVMTRRRSPSKGILSAAMGELAHAFVQDGQDQSHTPREDGCFLHSCRVQNRAGLEEPQVVVARVCDAGFDLRVADHFDLDLKGRCSFAQVDGERTGEGAEQEETSLELHLGELDLRAELCLSSFPTFVISWLSGLCQCVCFIC